MPLSFRHEHDHFPIPKECGGKKTVPACINCHDLKDRTDLEKFNVDLLLKEFHKLSPIGRIFLARVIKLYAYAKKGKSLKNWLRK